ncbi:MAG: CocE/NonD family hydrolase [Lachnospiraceae bacterium]|nr:CocE/NonD family hydrolase [Lachnospiraceae bacterium]
MDKEYLRYLYGKVRREPETGIKERRVVMLPVEENVRLKTILYVPEGVSYGPVIFTRSCYPQTEELLTIHGEEYCKRGYFFCYQWCRGLGGSEGVWEPNVYERRDGLASLQWICKQSFTESVGYWGSSYLAYNGWCMADAVPEKVKTMYLGVYGTDRHISAYQDGLFRHDILTAWAMENAGFVIEADYEKSCLHRPQQEVDVDIWGQKIEWYREWILSPDADAYYWNQGMWKELREIPGKVKIPIFIREGWYDHHLGGALAAWKSLNTESALHSILQIGPWNHDYKPAIMQGTEKLLDDQISSPFQWFERILRNKEQPQKEVLLYVIGADRWEKWSKFPVPVKKWEKLYMDFSRKKDRAYRLVKKAGEVVKGKTEFIYDPENPVYSHGAESLFHTKKEIGSILQEPCGFRDDVVSLLSEAFFEDCEINGEIKIRLFVSSDAEDTAFSVKVIEVFPDGRAVNIRTGITTLAYRNGADRRQIYQPGEIVEITISLWSIAWKIEKGSCLRVDISSSDFPQYAVHTNYPGEWAIQKHAKKAIQRIYSQIGSLCEVELPLVDNKGRK